MYKLLLFICFLLLSPVSFAEGADGIPQSILDQIYKKHPNAADFTVEKKNHYSQDLLKIHYKEGEEKYVDYFRPDGHYFVAGHLIAADDMMFTDSKEKLKAEFNDYKIRDAVLIVNPNGNGEEFDVLLENGGKLYAVLIDKKGNIEKSEVE